MSGEQHIRPRISLVVAVGENGVIGRGGALPWRLSGDLKYFKRVTLGRPVIMGRKTYESIGKPLPGRTNIVVSRQQGFEAPGCLVCQSFEAALEAARREAVALRADEICVIGGAGLYDTALAGADRIYLTEVHLAPEGDTFFPKLDKAQWREIQRDLQKAGDRDDGAYDFVILDRVGTGA